MMTSFRFVLVLILALSFSVSACESKSADADKKKEADKAKEEKAGEEKGAQDKAAEDKAAPEEGAAEEGAPKEEGSAEEGGAAAEGGTTTLTLASLDNLKLDVTAGTEPTEMGGMLMIMSMNEALTVGAAGEFDPKTLEDAKKEATETYTGKNLVEETLENGWLLTFDNEGGMGANFFVWVHLEIGGKAYLCQTTVGDKVLADGAVKACKTLRQ